MTDAQERAKEQAWNLVMNMNLEEVGGVDRAIASALAFAAKVEAETWEQAAELIVMPAGWDFRPVERAHIMSVLEDIQGIIRQQAHLAKEGKQ